MKASRPHLPRFYRRLLIAFLVTGLLPVLFLSSSFYLQTRVQRRTEAISEHERHLRLAVDGAETAIIRTMDASASMIVKSVFVRFEAYPGRSRLEGAQGELTDEDLALLYDFLSLRDMVISELSSFRAGHPHVQSIYYVDLQRRTVLTTSPHTYVLEEFHDTSWLPDFAAMEYSPAVLDPRTFVDQDGRTAQTISVLTRPLPAGSRGVGLVVNLSPEILGLERPTGSPVLDLGTRLVVTDGGDVIASSSDHGLLPIVRRVLDGGSSGPNSRELDGYVIGVQRSETLSWIFVGIVPQADLFRGLGAIQAIIWVSVILSLLVVAAIVVLSVGKVYSPIARIVTMLRGDGRRYDPAVDPITDEFAAIEGRLSLTLPAYRHKVLRDVVTGNREADESAEGVFSECGLGTSAWPLVVIVLAVPELISRVLDPRLQMVQIARFRALARRELARGARGILVEVEATRIALILSVNDERTDLLTPRLIAFTRVFEEATACRCLVGVGAPAASVDDIHVAYEQACEAVQYTGPMLDVSVVRYEDIVATTGNSATYPTELEAQIAVQIAAGRSGEAARAVRHFVETVKASRPAMPRLQFQHLFLRLYRMLVDLAVNAGGHVIERISDSTDVETVLCDYHEERLAQWFSDLASRLATAIGESACAAPDHTLTKQVTEYLQESYRSASLVGVADRFDVSASYLSRVFRENTGVTFVDYLTGIRIEKACALLLESEKGLQKIANEVGYSNSNYLIRVFRKRHGMTPGEYRLVAGAVASRRTMPSGSVVGSPAADAVWR